MLHCQICSTNAQTDLLTRCCKLFICEECREKYEKANVCVCGKVIQKKLCTSQTQLFQLIQNYYANMPPECDRCEQPAEIQCKNCEMLFCKECSEEIHAGAGFAKHNRQAYHAKHSHGKVERMKKKQEMCKVHKLICEFICDCGAMLCVQCQKTHRDTCSRPGSKIKPLKEYKQEFFSQIYHKLKQITSFKEKLSQEKNSYEQHFQKQKELFEQCSHAIQDQLKGLKKILEVKSKQVEGKLAEYWDSCQLAYKKNLYVIDHHLKKYDDYARLTERFSENYVGLDYLEKRVKRYQISYDFFTFKVCSIEDIQNSIVSLATASKQWQINNQENILLNFENPNEEKLNISTNNGKEKKLDLLGDVPSNSQLLLECSQKPLTNRPMNLKSSHNEIYFEFLHLPYQNDMYEIQYGVGLKMKGQEVFKRINNANGKGSIANLNPSTKYRVRMRVMGGEWGPVKEIKTYETPKFSLENCFTGKQTSDNSLQLLRSATIYGTNEICFGVHTWEMKITSSKTEEETACISMGISNKENKKPIFVGTTINYGYQKGIIFVKATLNCEENRLIISCSTNNQDEVFQNLPNYPVYPTIQNKGNSSVNIMYNFT